MKMELQSIFDIIEDALARAGYKVLDGDDETVFIRNSAEDKDFKISIEEVTP